MQERTKITLKGNPNVALRAIPGHFITPHAHANYYLEMTEIKTRTHEARAAALELAKRVNPSTVIDTIVCMEGTEVIGAYLAEELTKNEMLSVNTYKSINIVTPEMGASGQYVFRDNLLPMINGKNTILLVATAATGQTLAKTAEALKYYGADLKGICSIFSVGNNCFGKPIRSLFSLKDLPDYKLYTPETCAMCKEKHSVDAFANAFGYSQL